MTIGEPIVLVKVFKVLGLALPRCPRFVSTISKIPSLGFALIGALGKALGFGAVFGVAAPAGHLNRPF